MTTEAGALPELASVYWRPRVNERRLVRTARLWTLCTISHTLPFVGAAALLVALKPLTAPVAVILLVHAWIIPELYAARGAGVVRVRRSGAPPAEGRAMLLLGDLLGHRARELYAQTGLVIEPGELGTWLLGETGALLVRRGGRRVHCYCVRATDADLPPSDKVAHLLLALRADEAGFATVANLSFSGACWRLRRRLPAERREALAAAMAREAARSDCAAGPSAFSEPCTQG